MKKLLKAAERVFIITILITLLVCPGLYAAEETLPTPEEIIAKNIEAMGGKEALKKIKNKKIVTIDKIVQMNMVIKKTTYQERPNNYYYVQDTGVRAGANGKMVWEITLTGRICLREMHYHLGFLLGQYLMVLTDLMLAINR